MKIFLENKPKTIILSVIIVAALGGIVYFIFFYGQSESPAGLAPDLAVPAGGLTRESRVLPRGATLNLKVLDQEAFRILKPFAPVFVLPEELGKSNPFSQQ